MTPEDIGRLEDLAARLGDGAHDEVAHPKDLGAASVAIRELLDECTRLHVERLRITAEIEDLRGRMGWIKSFVRRATDIHGDMASYRVASLRAAVRDVSRRVGDLVRHLIG